MVTIQHTRKPSGRQPRTVRSAIYTAPSGREYVVEVLRTTADGSAEIVYQWAYKKYARAWVGVNDIEAVAR